MIPGQATLRTPFSCSGTTLHGGTESKVTVLPAPADSGLVFTRINNQKGSWPITTATVDTRAACTTLCWPGMRVLTVEHLLSALSGMGVDNAMIEIDSNEIPFMDGSAGPFAAAIERSGIRTTKTPAAFITPKHASIIQHGKGRIFVFPASSFSITYVLDYSHPLVGRAIVHYDPAKDRYRTKIADAQTFALNQEVISLRKRGLIRGGGSHCARIIKSGEIEGRRLKSTSEFAYHKILDLIGDLSLLGARLNARIAAVHSGHWLNHQLVRRIKAAHVKFERRTSA